MRSKIVEEQLRQCAYADLSNFDPKTNTYHIPKYAKPQYAEGKCYLVRLPKEILGDGSTALAANWNGGRSPKSEYYKAFVNRRVGTHIQVDCRAYDYQAKADLQEVWSGWLDITTLTQLAVIG